MGSTNRKHMLAVWNTQTTWSLDRLAVCETQTRGVPEWADAVTVVTQTVPLPKVAEGGHSLVGTHLGQRGSRANVFCSPVCLPSTAIPPKCFHLWPETGVCGPPKTNENDPAAPPARGCNLSARTHTHTHTHTHTFNHQNGQLKIPN